jgi:multidrug resistance efflux pump
MQSAHEEDPNRLPLIPIPFWAVWREFRIQVIPFVIFAMVLAAAAYMWMTMPISGNIRGVGEGLRSVVTSPRIGVIERLEAEPYQWVQAGDPLLTILPFDPAAQLDLLQSELQLTRLRLEPSVADRNAFDFEQVRVDSLRLKQELAMARVNLELAESVLGRNEKLVKDKLVSQDIYELSLRDRNLYQAEVDEKSASLKAIENRLSELRTVGEPQSPGTNLFTKLAIERLERGLAVVETNWSPITLIAPISGRVHMISRRESEFVVEGEPLMLIASPRADRIVAYMRQPFTFEPQAGMEVDVLLQNRERQKFTSTITQVGAQLEAITNALAFVQQGALVDMGLPIIIAVPSNVQLRPGETVSVVLRSKQLAFFGRRQAEVDRYSKPLVQLNP